MLELGKEEVARYPFLADAAKHVRETGLSIEMIGTEPEFGRYIDLALERIRAAADGGMFRPVPAAGTVTDASLQEEIFSFLVAVILLRLSGMQTLVRRFALAEARRAERHLESDLKAEMGATRSGSATFQVATRIIGDLFSVEVAKKDHEFVISAADYLRHSAGFFEREWKLVNRRVSAGLVHLTPHETVRLLRAEIGAYIRGKIMSAQAPQMSPGFEGPVSELILLGKKLAPEVAVTGERPPCIKHAMDVLSRGENLPHSGRFLLATFLLNCGQSVEQIAPLFKGAPDYNERVTLYQLNNLAGSSGGTAYSCPSCEKAASQGLCFATKECDGIFSPMQFGRARRP